MDFGELVEQRYSCRSYDPAQAVARTLVEKLIEAARLAPSACNRQPWRFAVVTEPETRGLVLDKGLRQGMPMPWARKAPVLIVLGMCRSLITHRLAPVISRVDYPWIDIGIAGEHLVLQATELGLGTCWIGWIRPDAIRRVVGWGRDVRPASLITVGWPKEPPKESRPRMPAEQIVKWV